MVCNRDGSTASDTNVVILTSVSSCRWKDKWKGDHYIIKPVVADRMNKKASADVTCFVWKKLLSSKSQTIHSEKNQHQLMLTSDVLYNSKTNTDLQLQSCLSVWRLIGDQFDMSPLSPSHFITGSTEAKQKYSTWSGIKHTHLAGEHFQSSCTFDRCTRCFTKIWLSGAGKSMIWNSILCVWVAH